MGTKIAAQSSRITYFVLIYALVGATCHAAVPIGHDHRSGDSISSLKSHGDALASRDSKINRKLLATKAWTTLWADEFDSWDSNKWSFQFQDGCQLNLCGWGNSELQYYTNNPNNVRVNDGKLIIEAKEISGTEKTAVQQECWDECGRRCVTQGFIDGTPELHTCVLGCGDGRCPRIRFTSGRITTVDKFSISPSAEYSSIRVEARIQLTPGAGLWPAFWMLPQDSKYGIWPHSGEIDIMESHTAMNAVNGTIHFGGSGDLRRYISMTTPISPGFHVFRTDWSEKEIRWYVDDKLYGSVANNGRTNRRGWYSAGAEESSTAPFGSGDNFFLLLNLAVGGAYPGFPSPESISQSMADGPKQMVVDYVRVMGR